MWKLNNATFFFFFSFLGLRLWHMEVPRLGVQSELQLPAYTTTTATWGLSHVFDLHHSSRQCQILNPRNKARDGTRNLSVPSRLHVCFSHNGNSSDDLHILTDLFFLALDDCPLSRGVTRLGHSLKDVIVASMFYQ